MKPNLDRARAVRVMDRAATLGAIAVVPIIFVEQAATDPGLLAAAEMLNWWIWWVFVADAAVSLLVIGRPWLKRRSAWISILVIVVSYPGLGELLAGTRLVRAGRLVRLGRASRIVTALRLTRLAAVASRATIGLGRLLDPAALPYVAFLVLLVVSIGGAALYLIEFEPGVLGFEDALWWAVTTVTTVGYGDIIPHSSAGRVVAVVVMVVGIAFTSLLTAQIAAYLNRKGQDALEGDVLAEIRLLAGRIEDLSRDVRRLEDTVGGRGGD